MSNDNEYNYINKIVRRTEPVERIADDQNVPGGTDEVIPEIPVVNGESESSSEIIIPEDKIYGISDQTGEETGSVRRGLFFVVLAVALFCIAFGIFKAWTAFREFDNAIMEEKDRQFYSLISSEDINIENSLDSFCREADLFFARERFHQLYNAWEDSGRKRAGALTEYIAENTLTANPVYADILIADENGVLLSASGNTDYVFHNEADGRGMRICSDEGGNYYLAYETSAADSLRYEALISIEQLYINSLGSSRSRGVMLMDSTSTIVVCQTPHEVLITSPQTEHDANLDASIAFLTECQSGQVSGGRSLELDKTEGGKYTARIIVQPSSKTTNGEFAIGITADFDEALRPSRRAAEKILVYGGMAIAGIIVLIFMLIFMRRINTANESELEVLKKKNTAMTELNQNMQALAHHQRLETIGTMTAGIAHDFNNLLTPIMGYSMMAVEMLPDDQSEIQDYMMEVYNASVKAKDIVQRLADLSKKGKEESFKELDPVEIIRSSLKVTLPAKPKNVEVRGRFSSGPARIRGDETQISQLVINIVINAYDAMRAGGGTLTVFTKVEDGMVEMRFTDTGTGMDSETLSKIFDPFYTTKESGKGTGLGLAIVHQICDTHGAKVYVDSEPGVGTEFRIKFPMVETGDFTKGTTRVIRTAEIRERLDEQTEY